MIGETVVRVRPGETTDRYGATVADWANPDEADIEGCAFAPGDTSEDHSAGRVAVIAGPTLYAPPGADIAPHDRIEARGEVFEVDGVPADWRSPYTNRCHGLAVPLRRVTG